MRLTRYYRHFIKDYGKICHPLTDLLRKYAFLWQLVVQQAFDALKLILTKALTLALPNFSQELIIEVDALGQDISTVLMQKGQPLAYLSKASSPKHLALSVYKKELLALLITMKKWHHYLQERHFLIRMDYQSLKYLLEEKIHTTSQHQWLSKLLDYDYSIVYKPGRQNQAADAFSRIIGEELLLMAILVVTNDLLKDI